MTNRRAELTATDQNEATEARHDLRAHLERWDCGQADDALLVFSELVTNAIAHAGGATRIHITRGDRTLRLEVHDQSHDVPVRRHGDGASGGFGLSIVGQLSEDWGWTQTDDGKIVWSDLPCTPD